SIHWTERIGKVVLNALLARFACVVIRHFPGAKGVAAPRLYIHQYWWLLSCAPPQAARRRGESWGTAPSPRLRAAALNNPAYVDPEGRPLPWTNQVLRGHLARKNQRSLIQA